MEQEVADMGRAIERLERAAQLDKELNDPANPVLVGKPERQSAVDGKRGTASAAYKKAFWNQLRGYTSYEVRNALQVGELAEGGYTVPDEFEHQLIEALQDENIMRGLVHVISTSSGDRKIPLVTNYGTASWIEEEAQIPESDVAFNQITLGAHKLATAIRISQELLNDSAFDLASFIAHEFQRRAGAAEEEEKQPAPEHVVDSIDKGSDEFHGYSPLEVFRKWRGFSTRQLSETKKEQITTRDLL
jgi:HK97 family phage major capsid protein